MESVYERMERLGTYQKMADFQVKMQQPYEFKKKYAEIRAKEFAEECEKRELNYHVSVGGLDSITLFLFLKSIGIDAPGITVSFIEDSSIQKIHRALGLTRLAPAVHTDSERKGKHWNKPEIIREFGFPVLSKEIAAKIDLLQRPTEDNKTVRHAIITGETGEYGGYQKNSRMKLNQRWLELFGGWDKEGEELGFKHPDWNVSSKCCYYLKEKPADDWAKAHNSVPYLGLMASEGGRRAKSLKMNGCNYFGKSTIRSAPFAIFNRQDLLLLTLEMDKLWKNKWKDEFYERGIKEGWFGEEFEMPESIVPEIYGIIDKKLDGTLFTTKAQRTGCSMCGFGIHMESRPHRFDLLRERNEKEWHFWMYDVCTDENGNHFGWGKVLDYIGVEWENDWRNSGQIEGQFNIFDYPEYLPEEMSS